MKKSLKVILFSDDYLPRSTRSHALMIHELAKELLNRGHYPVVLTPGNEDQNAMLSIDFIDNVEVWRFRSPDLRKGGKVSRAVRETMLPIRAWAALKSFSHLPEFDLSINYSPTIFFGLVASFFKKKGTFSYLILRDFFPQWAIDEKIISKWSPISWYFRFFERINYKSADVIAVQSPANVASFDRMTPYKHPDVEVLYNWADFSAPQASLEYGEALLKQYGIDKKTLFFYGGNIGRAQDMANIMRLARRMLIYPDVQFLLVGQGDEYQLVAELMTAWELDNVTLLDSINQDNYRSLLCCASVGLFSLAKNHSAHNFPGKLLGYMAASLPVLGSVNKGNDVKDLFNVSGAGLISFNGDDDALYSNAVSLLSDIKLRESIGRSANDLLKLTFSVSGAADQILSKVKSENG